MVASCGGSTSTTSTATIIRTERASSIDTNDDAVVATNGTNGSGASSRRSTTLDTHGTSDKISTSRCSSGDTMEQQHVSLTDMSTAATTKSCCDNADTDNEKKTSSSSTAATTTQTIDYSPCSNTGESHTSSHEEIRRQHFIAEQIVNTLQNDNDDDDCSHRRCDEIPIQQKRYPIIHYCNNITTTTTTTTQQSGTTESNNNRDNPTSTDIEEKDDADNKTKRTATADANAPELTENFCCWSSRGTVDVSALQDLVRHGYNHIYNNNINTNTLDTTGTTITDSNATTATNISTGSRTPSSSSCSSTSSTNYWDPVVAAHDNVFVRRPSHDAWGIPKIVLIYCDDFIQNVYTFPWFAEQQQQQQYEFRTAIQPILHLLQIPIHRIVRMLFASLPAGSTIPIHYDTGEWVKYTHRIHVPILVNDTTKILFRCGSSIQSLQRISCHPGHVFEINNQTYHTVSNCDTDYRVHLILDYIDEDYYVQTHPPPQRHTLQRGEIIYQTRRSMDRFINYGQRQTPTFLILGSQKAGTTYLFECIMSHPLAIKPRNQRRETHSLDWNYKPFDTIQKQRLYMQSFYYYKELQYHPSCFTGDSTPSYLMDHVRVIPRIKQLYNTSSASPRIKFIILCRHPIHRAISHYAMVTSTKCVTPAQMKSRGMEWRQKSFATIVIEDLIYMKQCGLLPYWTIPGLTIHTKIENNHRGIQFILQSMDTAIFNREKFDSFIGSSHEDVAWTKYVTNHVPLHTGSYGLVSRGLYHIQIRTWMKAFSTLTAGKATANDFLIYKFEAMTGNNLQQQPQQQQILKMKLFQQIWDHVHVPYYEIPKEILNERHNSREYKASDIVNESSSQLYHFLYRFYHHHNEQLHKLMQQQHQKQQQQGKYDQELFDHHWGESSVQWTEPTATLVKE